MGNHGSNAAGSTEEPGDSWIEEFYNSPQGDLGTFRQNKSESSSTPGTTMTPHLNSASQNVADVPAPIPNTSNNVSLAPAITSSNIHSLVADMTIERPQSGQRRKASPSDNEVEHAKKRSKREDPAITPHELSLSTSAVTTTPNVHGSKPSVNLPTASFSNVSTKPLVAAPLSPPILEHIRGRAQSITKPAISSTSNQEAPAGENISSQQVTASEVNIHDSQPKSITTRVEAPTRERLSSALNFEGVEHFQFQDSFHKQIRYRLKHRSIHGFRGSFAIVAPPGKLMERMKEHLLLIQNRTGLAFGELVTCFANEAVVSGQWHCRCGSRPIPHSAACGGVIEFVLARDACHPFFLGERAILRILS